MNNDNCLYTVKTIENPKATVRESRIVQTEGDSALTRMARFAEVFSDSRIVATLSQQFEKSRALLEQRGKG